MSEFLSRWSRLKRGETPPEVAPEALAEVSPAAPPDQAPADTPAPPPAETQAQTQAEPAFDLSLLPSLEELTVESDIRGFLHRAVPAGLRNAALKRIWALDPAIRDFVGPVDYAWDFNDPAGLPGISEALTGDVTALLARAIGAAPQQDTTPAPPEVAPQPEAAPQPPALVAAPTLPALEKPPTAAPRLADEAAPARRRHGGAQPI